MRAHFRYGLAVESLERRNLLTVPAVLSINRATPLAAETNAASVSYAVTFNESVTAVDSGDFLVTKTGSLENWTPVMVSGSGSTYLVTVNGIQGSGNLRLDLIDNDSILGPLGAGDPLGGVGAGNGNFQGQTYTVDRVGPSVVSINRVEPDPEESISSATSVAYEVTFSEPVTMVDATDFTLALTGSLTTSTPLAILGSGAVYTVTVNGLSGNGSLGLNLTDNGSIRDGAGNTLALGVPLDWSFVGNPGNQGEPVGHSVQGGGGPNGIAGAVDHEYRIGTYEVTFNQYAAFLNAKDPTGANALRLYSVSMGTDTINGGITLDNGGADGSKYAVMPGHDKLPVSYVNWYSAIRFANWTNNGQGNSDTESGAYTLFGGTPMPTNAASIYRNPTARAFLPSENEWHKAAYYNPLTHTYSRYATGSNLPPNYLLDPEDTNAANYTPGGWPDPDYELAIGHVTEVGAFASSPSRYGTFDQSGNVWEWNEDTIFSLGYAFKGMRGGIYSEIWDHLIGAYRGSGDPGGDYVGVGFRLASTPDFNANFTGPVDEGDMSPPAVTSITTANANPTGSLGAYYNVTFSEAVTGVNATDFVLVASGDGVNATITEVYGGGSNYTVVAVMSNNSAQGTLGLNLVDNDSIIDQVGRPLGGTGAGNGDFFGQIYIVSRDGYIGPFLFYRESSRYDTTGNPQAQLPYSHDNAIAPDKVAYLPGSGKASFANVSSYSKGINGLMIDFEGSHPSITAADFVFRVGNNNSPSSWATAPAPLHVSVRAGAGVSGSDRVEIIWDNSVIANTWLEVITLANANTGLRQKPGYPVGQGDVFYFGNAVGDSGNNGGDDFFVNSTDEIDARTHPAEFNNIPITNIYDFNRDSAVNSNEQIIVQNNPTGPLTVLKAISVVDPLVAPIASAVDHSAVPLVASAVLSSNYLLLPNTPGQQIQILVTGGDSIQGLNFNAQVGDGGPLFGGTPAPTISANVLTGTIFSANHTGVRDVSAGGQFAGLYTSTAVGSVSANGILATLTVDTSGFFSGTFPLLLTGTVNGDTDFAGLPIDIQNGSITIVIPSVVNRQLFYNQSGGGATRYDGNNLAINASDDLAIATDKTAYLWEDAGAATFANVSSYTKGINGIMVDITGSHPNITADDFIFRVGNNNSPGTWATIGATSVSVRAGAGLGGSDRVEIIWNGAAAPIKQWLEVIVLANADTGLAQKAGHPVGHGDAFFFGNAVGNIGAGDSAANSLVNALDAAGIRANNALLSSDIPITNIYDVNRNASVNATDESAARLNGTNPTTTLKYLNLTTAPAAPEADDGEISSLVATDSGVASALTAPAASCLTGGVPKWLLERIESIDLNSGSPAKLFQYLHNTNSPRSRALLQKFDAVADASDLDDELLELLVADLR